MDRCLLMFKEPEFDIRHSYPYVGVAPGFWVILISNSGSLANWQNHPKIDAFFLRPKLILLSISYSLFWS